MTDDSIQGFGEKNKRNELSRNWPIEKKCKVIVLFVRGQEDYELLKSQCMAQIEIRL